MTDTKISGESAGTLFIGISKYFLTQEYPSKLRHCIEALPESAVWARSTWSSFLRCIPGRSFC